MKTIMSSSFRSFITGPLYESSSNIFCTWIIVLKPKLRSLIISLVFYRSAASKLHPQQLHTP
uniref:CRB n=1 Tax=Arundo donax TaxID=35708 RepID=A0A0A9FS60_ARUDO